MNRYLGYKRIEDVEHDLRSKPESYWMRRGEGKAIRLFHQMSERVPAYKDFLKKNRVNAAKIKTIHDFSQVPTIDKDNYLRVYPRPALCWDGTFSSNRWTVSTTSGSTGVPYYFPRTIEQDYQYALSAELYLRSNFDIQHLKTLYINGFPMGPWIGGVFTYEAIRIVAERGKYPLSIITPGISKLDIINAVKNIGHEFDQILIGSYAPFLKDTLDDGANQGIDWKSYKLGFIFSAEAFSEVFRDYVFKKTGISEPHKLTLNHYGTVDLGTMSHETPLTIMIRRAAVKNPVLYKALFGQLTKLPTLTQYNPEQFYFEDVDGNLVCSSYSGIPLVRYDLKDRGGVQSLEWMQNMCHSVGYDTADELTRAHIDQTVWNLPVVYVYERSDFSVSFFAFQIYPETIRKALQHISFDDTLTGKFTMMVNYDTKGQQRFEIHIELKAGVKETSTLRKQTTEIVVKKLLEENSEYRKTHEMYGARVYPQLTFWQYEDTTYFRPGVKQKWVKNN